MANKRSIFPDIESMPNFPFSRLLQSIRCNIAHANVLPSTQSEQCEALDITQAEDGDVLETIELPSLVFDVREDSLYENYKTPENCELICVARMNTRTSDLAMQEVQKAVVKFGEDLQLVTMAECIFLAKTQHKTMDSQDLLGLISDALSFIGHAGYQTSFKRRYLS